MELRYSARAQRDLLDGSIRWRTYHPGRADLFGSELGKALELLRLQPRMGRRTNRYQGARVLVLVEIEHLLFYRVHRKHIAILALLPARAQRTPLR